MRKIFLLLTLCILSFVEASARELRSEDCFDTGWLFARYGMQAGGSTLAEPDNLWQTDADDSAWRTLDLPHDWGIEGPFRQELEGFTGKLPWRGIGWYRKHFRIPADSRPHQYYIDFDGAMANAQVWVNGQLAGGHPYGYSSFRVNITPYVMTAAENVVAVRLDTENMGSRWYPGAGIYRHVRLVTTSPVHVSQWGVFVTTPRISSDNGTAQVRVAVSNHQKSAVQMSFGVDIHELADGGKPGRKVATGRTSAVMLAAGTEVSDSLLLNVPKPRLWSLENTSRYVARVTVYADGKKTDTYDQTFGFRTIEFTHDRGFLLNGRHVQLNGTCNHHDLGALGAAVHTSALRRQLTILKSFGCNALRTSHNAPTPELLDLADEMGFLVLDEAFDCWEHGKKPNDYASLFKEWHEHDLRSLISRDRNHPSVIMWSTGNEVHEQYYPETGMARHLTGVVHKYDTTRPATFGASYPAKSAINGTELQVDVHGMNYAAGVYGGPDFYGKFLNMPGHETICGYSSESSSTLSSRGEYFPRRFQVSAYDDVEPGWGSLPDAEFAALDKYPAICGEFVWTGFDYLGEPTPYNSDMSVLLNHSAAVSAEELAKQRKALEDIEKNRPTSRSSYFGIVDMAGFPKDRYYMYKAHWLPDEPLVYIAPHWNHPGREGSAIPVQVYTSGDEVELFVNGLSQGRKKKGQYQYRLKWDNVTYQPGTVKAVAYRNGQPWAESEVRTTGKAVAIKLTPDKQVLASDGDDLVFVRISFVDANGNEVPNTEPVVTCSATGCGKVVATDNGDATCHITFSEPVRPAFNGLLLAIVKANRGSKGDIVFKATADGLDAAELRIKAVR